MEQVNAVAAPFCQSVHVLVADAPGEVSSKTVRFFMVPAVGKGASQTADEVFEAKELSP